MDWYDTAPEPEGVKTGDLAAQVTGEAAFAWETCSGRNIHARVAIKQLAVDNALQNALTICKELRASGGDGHPDPAESFRHRCGKELVEWMDEIDSIHETSRKFEILIGVAGRTGAGKSTILNMLLEIPELLPSSNSEAATSCVCRVSWNEDEDPDHQFRAEVVFRSLDDVAQEIRQLFHKMEERQKLKSREPENGAEAIEQMDEEAEIESEIAEGFNKIGAVWDLDEESLEGMAVEDVLESKPEVLQLLGTTKAISCADAERFAELVKPYLDSSETSDGFRAWPLITEVRLYVKAPILKHGIVLVDLPGLSDAVESRARVAESFAQKLGVTAIVTPARRAIDEKTGVQLMSEYQALRMQLDGKYHKKSFCVVVSQIDEIDCDVFLKHAAAKQNQSLTKETAQIGILRERSAKAAAKIKPEQEKLKAIDAELAKAAKSLAALTPTGRGSSVLRKKFKPDKEKIRNGRKEVKKRQISQKKKVSTLEKAKAVIDNQLARHLGRQKWLCVRMQNAHITQAIERDFALRQKALARDMPGNNLYDGSVAVIPVSATAFRDRLKGREPTTFPTLAHTGIPRLRQWLADSTLERREEHLNGLLNALRRLFMRIRCWSSANCGNQPVVFSEKKLEDLLIRTQVHLSTELQLELNQGFQAVEALEPLDKMKYRLGHCKREACRAANRWALKSPEDKTSAALMNWITFDAILRRSGGPYRSKTGQKREYNFHETMAVSVLRALLDGWHKVFRVQIPSAERFIVDGVGKIWQQYLINLESHISQTSPHLLPYLEEGMDTVRGIEAEIKDRIHDALKRLSECSSEVHPEFLEALRGQLAPIFKSSLEIRGQGHYKQRRTHIFDRVKQRSNGILAAGFERMNAKYQENLGQLSAAFTKLAEFAASELAKQIKLTLFGNGGSRGRDWAVADMQPSLQQRLRGTVMEWQLHWQVPKLDQSTLEHRDFEIPERYEDGVDQAHP